MAKDGRDPQVVAGFPTHVSEMGRGVRRALFIHCSLAHSGAWLAVEAALLDKLSMVAFDRPSHGRSGVWMGGEDAAALHKQTTRIAAQLLGKRADVIGHSWGGTVALRLAIERGEQVRSLALYEPVLLAAAAGHPAFEAHRALMGEARAAFAAGDRARAAQMFHDEMNPDNPWAGLPEKVQGRMADEIHTVFEEVGVAIDDAAGLCAPGMLEKIKQPVLLMEGTSTAPVVRAANEALCARIPQAQRVIVVGAGHMGPVTHPDNVAGEVAAFLKV